MEFYQKFVKKQFSEKDKCICNYFRNHSINQKNNEIDYRDKFHADKSPELFLFK